jgi:hypothetical protein
MTTVPHPPRQRAAPQLDADHVPQRVSTACSPAASSARGGAGDTGADLRMLAAERRAEIEAAVARWSRAAAPQVAVLRTSDRRPPRTDRDDL